MNTTKSAPRKGDRLYKTVMCKNYKTDGKCKYGKRCTFAHGFKELRKNHRPRAEAETPDLANADVFPNLSQPPSVMDYDTTSFMKLNPDAPVFVPTSLSAY